ncbi:uncharacterized protein LOC115626567 [Scaptodrosophila lebanonensis]|uniref:Uncharacterized protein LOC115626567 n=1 Tax=Drosophila lebanonensis TaxID=7225 RepID=A0A6J2TMK1_DROLE|nr:uncharacterized protein LOC115626567 [Scaptodrosophila lebanonensis]
MQNIVDREWYKLQADWLQKTHFADDDYQSKMFKILAFLSGYGLLLVLAQEFPSDVELSELTPEEQVTMEPKINWLPVWVPPEVHEQDFLARQARDVEPEIAITLNPDAVESLTIEPLKEEHDTTTVAPLEERERDGDGECPSTTQRGLMKLIRDARSLLPADSLRNILANAVSDPEVRQLITLLRGDDFRARVARLRSTKEHNSLLEFICKRLRLNYDYYVDWARIFLSIQQTVEPTKPLPNRRRGVRGLLLDLRDELPRKALRDLYSRQLAADGQLATAVRLIRSTEFRRLLREYRARREYREVRALLERAGVPLQQVLQLVASALGWGNVDLGGETLILNV